MESLLFASLVDPDGSPALILDDHELDRRALARAAGAHAALLAREGISPGDRVAVWTQRGPHAAVALVGNALAGAVTVPLNPALGERELEHVVRDAAPKLAFAGDLAVASRTPSIRTLRGPIEGSHHDDDCAPARRVDDDPLLVLYTSGTTGAPKGAVLTARNVASNLDALASAWGLTERDRIVHALPLFHVHGLCLGLFGALRSGASLDWRSRFDPVELASRFDRGATVLYAVPTMYHRLVERAESDPVVAAQLARARLLVSGSAPLATREFHRIERACGQRVLERYGLTETLINCAVRHDAEPRAGWVGPPVDGVALELVDDQRNNVIPSDGVTLGEVRVRGANVFAGYLDNPAATAATMDDSGWFYTGDLAVRDERGWVRIVGRRATDLIKTGGFKVGAGEVESALREHRAVADCAVVGVEDDDLGERIEAFVVLREEGPPPTADELSALVATLLSAHKRPRVVHFCDELPRNAMGKVLKAPLRARALDARAANSARTTR
jgi:malonyl-CoA/methylmalonyl-CoA synthetase